MLTVIEIIGFIIWAIFLFYLPGKFLLEQLKISLSRLEEVSIATIWGVLIFTLISLLIRSFKLPFFITLIPYITFDFFYLYKNRIKLFRPHQSRFHLTSFSFGSLITLLIIILAIFSQNLRHFTSGIITKDGLIFLPFRDASFHLSLIGEFKNHFPFENPLFSGVPLKNYHFLTDFLIASINSLFPIPLFDFYFRLFPIFTSLLFVLLVYLLLSQLTQKVWVKNLGLFLAVFAGPFSYLIPLVKKGGGWDAFSFMLNQPFDLAFNSQTIFGFILFLVGVFSLLKYQQTSNKNLIFLAGLIFASSFGFKAYASTLGMFSFSILAIYMFLVKKNFFFLKTLLIGSIVFFILIALLIDSFRNGLHFAPFWTLKRMVEDPGALNLPELSILEQHYLEKNNWARVAQINLEEATIYTFGNLGIRVLGFLYLLSFFRIPHKLSLGVVFIIAATLASLFIPIFFNQGGSPYNIIQFGAYSLILTSIFSALFLEKIATRVKIFKKRIPLFILWGLIVFLAIPTTVKTFVSHLKPDRFIISFNELAVLDNIKRNLSPWSVILLYPSEKNRDLSYVSALSQKRVFLSHQAQVDLVNLSYENREKEVQSFFYELSGEKQKTFIQKNQITHIYLTSEDQKELEKVGKKLPFNKLLEEDGVILYQVN